MSLGKIICSFRWFAYSPRQRRDFFYSQTIRDIAWRVHKSIELRVKGKVTLGRSVGVGRYTVISVQPEGHLICGDNAWIGDNCEVDACGVIEIGANTSLQHRTILIGEVSIGAGCLFGPNIYISSARHRFEDRPELPIRWQDAQFHANNNGYIGRPVCIGEDCWFGTNVVVMPGVTVGRGCIIGANSVITGDVPPYSVVAGAPARVLKARLAFVPPLELFANRIEHLPYFYSGFKQWGEGIASLDGALQSGGWFAKDRFALTISAQHGNECELQIYARDAGVLTHGEQAITVFPGEQTVTFRTLPTLHGILEFFWSAQSSEDSAGLVILRAKKCQPLV